MYEEFFFSLNIYSKRIKRKRKYFSRRSFEKHLRSTWNTCGLCVWCLQFHFYFFVTKKCNFFLRKDKVFSARIFWIKLNLLCRSFTLHFTFSFHFYAPWFAYFSYVYCFNFNSSTNLCFLLFLNLSLAISCLCVLKLIAQMARSEFSLHL